MKSLMIFKLVCNVIVNGGSGPCGKLVPTRQNILPIIWRNASFLHVDRSHHNASYRSHLRSRRHRAICRRSPALYILTVNARRRLGG
jgi:hypothetical protein